MVPRWLRWRCRAEPLCLEHVPEQGTRHPPRPTVVESKVEHSNCATRHEELRLLEARAEGLGRLLEPTIARHQVISICVLRGSEAFLQMTSRDDGRWAHVDCRRFGVIETD